MSTPTDKLLDAIQTSISMAVQLDLEQGVRCLNEAASEDFHKKFPLISQALSDIADLDVDEPEGLQDYIEKNQ